jgi:hypothetical protein
MDNSTPIAFVTLLQVLFLCSFVTLPNHLLPFNTQPVTLYTTRL